MFRGLYSTCCEVGGVCAVGVGGYCTRLVIPSRMQRVNEGAASAWVQGVD